MDNSGVMGGMFNSDGERKAIVSAPSDFEQLRPEEVAGSFDAYVDSGAVLAPNVEAPKVDLGPAPEIAMQFPNSAEQLNGVGEAMPAISAEAADGKPKGYESEAVAEARKKAEAEEAKRKAELAALPADYEAMDATPIARDAEKIPKSYMHHYANGVKACLNSNDPAKLVAFCDVARWDYMGKCFDRNLGDGLHGRTA